MLYKIDDLTKMATEFIEVEAKSPLEAAKIAFPNCKITRDYENKGNLLVYGKVKGRKIDFVKCYVYQREELQ